MSERHNLREYDQSDYSKVGDHVLNGLRPQVPCQLHELLGVMSCGLARVSKQLHSETAGVPYAVNTFSLHNLYYLQTFLQVIGEKGRHNLKSLRFQWKLPEEDALSLGLCTNVQQTYRLLAECKSLVNVDVEIDAKNLLIWRGSGKPRSEMLNYLYELPHLDVLYGLRGMQQIKISWKTSAGLIGMEAWAKYLINFWSLPHGASWKDVVDTGDATLVETEDPDLVEVIWRAASGEKDDS